MRGGWALAAMAAVGLMAAAARDGGEALTAADARVVSGMPSADVPATPVSAWSPDSLDESARALSRLHSLLVSRGGELVFERYYNGARRDRSANIKPASKS